MKKYLTFFILFLANYVLAGGDSIDNGADLFENRIVLAFNNIETYIEATIKDTSNTLDVNQYNLLTKILYSIPEEKKMNPNMIQFSDESERFYIDGKMKIAFTWLQPGAPIFFNRKYLQYLNENNKHTDFSTFQALSILIHELGHHQGIADHTYLDYLGSAVASKSRFEEKWYVLNPKDKILGAQLFTPIESLKLSASFNIVNWSASIDITSIILNMELCKSYQIGVEQRNLQYWNVYWESSMSSTPELRALLSYDCRWPNGEWVNRIGDLLMVKLNKKYIGNTPAFSFDKMIFKVIKCEVEEVSCLKNQNSIYMQKLNNKNISNKEDNDEK